MNKLFLSLIFLGFAYLNIHAQKNSSVLMHVNGKAISTDEFIRIYQKNNPSADPLNEKDLREYLELFINFKLKVTEAESLGLDTASTFVSELNGYRKQLAKPYLMDQKVDDELLQEAYERMQWDINASHILINIQGNRTPADTLAAYKKISDIRSRIEKGESFERLARQYSDDPSAKKNDGNLGYFTGFQMVYPFETAAFNTAVGELSPIVRTRFGYHLLKIHDKRPAVGSVKVAHIMIASKNAEGNPDEAALAKITNIYEQLQAGAEFAELAEKYSDDKGSAVKGGELPEFGTGRMIPEFERTAFALTEPGQLSEPFQTSYGYHIVKMIERTGIASFEEMEKDLRNKIQRDERSTKSKDVFLEQLKKDYAFQDFPKAFEKYLKAIPDSAPGETWEATEVSTFQDVLFELNGQAYAAEQFTNHLLDGRTKRVKTINKMFIESEYDYWVEKVILAFEDSRLEAKHPEFKYLMQEYHDGILLFELSDQKVWSKALKDSVGLEAFYKENLDRYQWSERLDCSVYTLIDRKDTPRASDEEVEKMNKKALKKLRSLAKKRAKKEWSKDEFLIQAKEITSKLGSSYQVNVNDRKAEAGSWHLLKQLEWKKGISDNFNEVGETIFVVVKEIIPAQPKQLHEIKGLVTADYQNYLEKVWIEELRNKYPVEVNEESLQALFNK